MRETGQSSILREEGATLHSYTFIYQPKVSGQIFCIVNMRMGWDREVEMG